MFHPPTGSQSLVCSETEDKSKSWEERKRHTIEHLANARQEIQVIACADKLSNMRDIEREFEQDGAEVFRKFNVPPARVAWYYTEVVKSLQPLAEDPKFRAMYRELSDRVERVFGNLVREKIKETSSNPVQLFPKRKVFR